ncbi:MAG: hypothetical protein EON55_07415 [Alphaproteobacteria bacterium]|nr:MAG: hypothetical protein EON55_07415 [Alphaproteobacteria bacterium]
MTPPVIALDAVHHIGDMDPSSKRTGSYEGAGLSVSVHPGAWRVIGRGMVGGACWTMRREGARFLDAHAMKRAMRRSVLDWGVGNGLCVVTPLWRFSHYDDELECRVSQTFPTLAEAKEESWDGDLGRVRRVTGHASTPSLDAASMQPTPSHGDDAVLDLLLPLWAHAVHGLDGVWWEDRLDVLTHSAPRGVIVAEMVSAWSAERLDRDPPDDGSDEWDEDESDGHD